MPVRCVVCMSIVHMYCGVGVLWHACVGGIWYLYMNFGVMCIGIAYLWGVVCDCVCYTGLSYGGVCDVCVMLLTRGHTYT